MQRTPHRPRKVGLTVMKALRLSSGLDLKHIEEHGINKFTYIKIETGNRRASRPSVRKICDLFSLRPHFLFDKEGYAIAIRPTEIMMLAQYKRVRRKQ